MRRRAIAGLIGATILWGISFVTMRAISLVQLGLAPGCDSWIMSTATVTVRYASAAVVLLLVWRGRGGITRREIMQGLVLGFFHGLGLLFQADGLAHTDASVSAFLTQCYCVFLPLWSAWRQRRPPGGRISVSVALVMTGIALLAHVDWHNFRLGRGEWETLVSSVLFTGQILWLEKAEYSDNRPMQITFVMLAAVAAMLAPVLLLQPRGMGFVLHLFSPASVWVLMAVLVVFSTVFASLLMNRWQRHVTSTEAGLIYGSEPVYATLFALFVPALYSRLADVDYPNEQLSANLLAGGALIFSAIVLMQWRPAGANSN